MMNSLPTVFTNWFTVRGWAPHPHQPVHLRTFRRRNALLIAPTGGGKTLAGFLPSLVDLHQSPTNDLHTLYVSPLKALSVDIHRNLSAPVSEMGLNISLDTRTGDTPQSARQRQRRKPPNILLTTPNLSLLLSYEDSDIFNPSEHYHRRIARGA